jgi:hypothetical protein
VQNNWEKCTIIIKSTEHILCFWQHSESWVILCFEQLLQLQTTSPVLRYSLQLLSPLEFATEPCWPRSSEFTDCKLQEENNSTNRHFTDHFLVVDVSSSLLGEGRRRRSQNQNLQSAPKKTASSLVTYVLGWWFIVNLLYLACLTLFSLENYY